MRIVSQFNYLRMLLSNGRSLMKCNTLSSKAVKVMNILFVNVKLMDGKNGVNLFDELVTPILSYACETWGFARAETGLLASASEC